MDDAKVTYVSRGLSVCTSGLQAIGCPEFRAEVSTPILVPGCENFLRFLVAYVKETKAVIKCNQTLAYGFWLVKFQASKDGFLEVFEYDAEATKFIPGISLAVTYWQEQHEMCNQLNTEFAPPRPDRIVVISDGVLEGHPVEGVRYPSPEHMSGWWLTTSDYSGDIKDLQKLHLFHVTSKRPDLVRYLALPYGFRFSQDTRSVWFDEIVAKG